ncbi:hypothetical protein ACFL59_12450 [Planctomycetota bacterium]
MVVSITQWVLGEGREEDVDAVMRVVRMSMGRKVPSERLSEEEGHNTLKQWFAIPDTGALLARSFLSKRVDGVLVFRDDSPTVRVVYLGVREPRQGVGSTMLRMLQHSGTAHGWQTVEAIVNPADECQKAFFLEKHGFGLLEEADVVDGVTYFCASRNLAAPKQPAGPAKNAAGPATSESGRTPAKGSRRLAKPVSARMDRARKVDEKTLGPKLLGHLKAVHDLAVRTWEDPKQGFAEIDQAAKAAAKVCRTVTECIAQIEKHRSARQALMAQMGRDRNARELLASRLAAKSAASAVLKEKFADMQASLEARLAAETKKRLALEAELLQTRSDLEAELTCVTRELNAYRVEDELADLDQVIQGVPAEEEEGDPEQPDQGC